MGKKGVCFDLGGVLVRINRTWRLAAMHAGVTPHCPSERLAALGGFAAFEAYQRGQLADAFYLPVLADYLELDDDEDALLVHQGILDEAYPGTEELVASLHRLGVPTLCLSNTNSLHWARMCGPEFPGIASLQLKFASHELKLEKPRAAIYEALEHATGFAPDQIVFFEDGPANIDGALARGWHAHLIDPFGDPAEQMRQHLVCEGIL